MSSRLSFRDQLLQNTLSQRAPRTVESARYVSSLPTVSPRDLPAEDRDCSICLDPYPNAVDIDIDAVLSGEETDIPVRLPCNHVLGRHCLTQWLSTSNKCPLCRHQLFAAPFRSSSEMIDRVVAEALAGASARVPHIMQEVDTNANARLAPLPRRRDAEFMAVSSNIDGSFGSAVTNRLFGTGAPFFGTRAPSVSRQAPAPVERAPRPRMPPAQSNTHDERRVPRMNRLRRGELRELIDVERLHGINRESASPPPVQQVEQHSATPLRPQRGTPWRRGARRGSGFERAQPSAATQISPHLAASQTPFIEQSAGTVGGASALVRRTARTNSRAEPYTVPGTGAATTERRVTRAMSKDGGVALEPGL